MTIEAIFELYAIAVSSADACRDTGSFQSEADVLAHDAEVEAALVEIERLQGLLVTTPSATLAGIAGKLRVAREIARKSGVDSFPEWRLIGSALRDLSAFVSVSVTPYVPEATS